MSWSSRSRWPSKAHRGATADRDNTSSVAKKTIVSSAHPPSCPPFRREVILRLLQRQLLLAVGLHVFHLDAVGSDLENAVAALDYVAFHGDEDVFRIT